ncbi:MAG: transposase [Blastocatellia bacterium]|nr:transposase [Blastocatellia bacterium]
MQIKRLATHTRKKTYFNPVWKGQHLKVENNYITLPMGIDPHSRKRQLGICIRLPKDLPEGKIVQAELAFGKLLLTIQNQVEVTKPVNEKIATSDLGSIHLSVVTDGQDSLAVVGRGLRSINQGKAKALAEISQLQSRCQKHSKRWTKLQKAKYKILNKAENQTKDLLHKAANELVEFCKEKEVSKLVVGDITEINRGKKDKTSRRLNQEMGLLSLCKFVGVRDEVGAINLLNKYLNKGEIKPNFLIPKGKVKYLRPVKLKNFARRSRAADTGHPSIHALCADG